LFCLFTKILKSKPDFNKQVNSQSAYEIKTLIITACEQHSEIFYNYDRIKYFF
jgi:hypothetical protein